MASPPLGAVPGGLAGAGAGGAAPGAQAAMAAQLLQQQQQQQQQQPPPPGGAPLPAAGPPPVQMGAAQLQQLLAARNQGEGRRVSPFSSGLPEDFLAWRNVFGRLRALKGWDDQTSLRQLAAGLEGAACRMTSDIQVDGVYPVGHPMAGQNVTYDSLMAAYQERFIPASLSKLARTQFLQSAQESTETLVSWHTRLRELYMRAHPGAAIETSHELVERFILGIYDGVIREKTFDVSPATYSEALTVATTKAATRFCLMQNDGLLPNTKKSTTPQNLSMMAMSANPIAEMGVQRAGEGGTVAVLGPCFYCQAPGHIKRDCRKRLADLRARRGNRGGGGRRGGGQRGRGRGAGTPGRNNSGQFSARDRINTINALVDKLDGLDFEEEGGQGN